MTWLWTRPLAFHRLLNPGLRCCSRRDCPGWSFLGLNEKEKQQYVNRPCDKEILEAEAGRCGHGRGARCRYLSLIGSTPFLHRTLLLPRQGDWLAGILSEARVAEQMFRSCQSNRASRIGPAHALPVRLGRAPDESARFESVVHGEVRHVFVHCVHEQANHARRNARGRLEKKRGPVDREPGPNTLADTGIFTRSHGDSRPARRSARSRNGDKS